MNAPTNAPVNQQRSGKLLRGEARMLEIARQDEAARQAEIAKITADLGAIGCVPTRMQALLIDELAGMAVRSRRLRSNGGRSAEVAECTRLISRLASQLGLNRAAKARPQTSPLAEYLKTLPPELAEPAGERDPPEGA